jgi:Transcriptional regulator, AbiEi antitoxin/Protein of unknown function (DUF559)
VAEADRPNERPPSVEMRVARLAAAQFGVVTAAQLRSLGVEERTTRERAQRGVLHRIHRGVYAVGHPWLSPDGVRLAAVLACGPGAVLSHRAAARLWRIRSDGALREVTTPGRRVGPPDVLLHRTRRLGDDDVTEVDGIPVTSVARTIVDLAEVVTLPILRRVVHEAEVLRLLDVRAVEEALGRVPGRRRARHVLSAIDSPAPDPTNSAFVAAFLGLCERFGLPRPQVSVLVDAGGLEAEADCLFARARLIVELDGEHVHGTHKRFHADRRRDAALAAAGYLTVRLTWRRVTTDAEAVAEELRRMLAARTPPAEVVAPTASEVP